MAEETKNCCCSQRRKVRERTEEEALLQRLSRIEGQVRGVRGMVENSAYCTDILTQVSAIQSALNAFNRELLARHIRTCVVTDIQKGDRTDFSGCSYYLFLFRIQKGFLGNSEACGVCHSFGADGRCISLLKVLMTNHCVYDCKYCMNRCSNDIPRATFAPDELCQLVIEFYRRNYIEGLFLSSGVLKNPAYTMEKICETLLLLRTKYRFNGYIHVKAIPGAPS